MQICTVYDCIRDQQINSDRLADHFSNLERAARLEKSCARLILRRHFDRNLSYNSAINFVKAMFYSFYLIFSFFLSAVPSKYVAIYCKWWSFTRELRFCQKICATFPLDFSIHNTSRRRLKSTMRKGLGINKKCAWKDKILVFRSLNQRGSH